MGLVSGNPTWVDYPSTDSPISAGALNNLEDGIDSRAAATHSHALGNLSDVDLSGAAEGDTIVRDGSGDYVPTPLPVAHVAAVTIPTGWTTSTGITVTGLVDTSAAMIGPVNSGSEWGSDWVITTGTDTLTVTGTAPDAAVSAKLIWWT